MPEKNYSTFEMADKKTDAPLLVDGRGITLSSDYGELHSFSLSDALTALQTRCLSNPR